jgi:hypothetical protein
VKRASGRKTHGRPWATVHAQIGVAHRVAIEVADRHRVIARRDGTHIIELESTIVAPYVAYLKSTGACRAA